MLKPIHLRPRRVIDSLRVAFPDVTWTFDREGRGSRWVASDGRSVRAYSEMAPRYDGDDNSFRTSYRWEDTGEEVFL